MDQETTDNPVGREDIRYGRKFPRGDIPSTDSIVEQVKEDPTKGPGGLFFLGLKGLESAIDSGVGLVQNLADFDVDMTKAYLESRGVYDDVEEVRRATPADVQNTGVKDKVGHILGTERHGHRSVVVDLDEDLQGVEEFLDNKENTKYTVSDTPNNQHGGQEIKVESGYGRDDFTVYPGSDKMGVGGHRIGPNPVENVEHTSDREELVERIDEYGRPSAPLETLADYLENRQLAH